MPLTRKSRIRMQHSIADIVMVELWLAGEDQEIEDTDVENCFSRIQARMLVLQALLWPQEGDESEWRSAEDVQASAEAAASATDDPAARSG